MTNEDEKIEPERSDDTLISEYRSGRDESLKALIDRYAGPIYGFAYRMTGRREDADDISQETFVKVWRRLEHYRTNGTFKAWVFAIARNTAIDRLRKKRMPVFSDFEDADGRNPLADTISDPEMLPAAIIEKAEQKGLVESALLALAPEDREIMLLHYTEGMTFENIGAVLAKPPNTVKSRHRRALARLREYLEKYP